MPDANCLSGPAFSLVGDALFSGTAIDFQVVFDNPADQAGIKAYEWYLDKSLVIGQNTHEFTRQVTCGGHNLGVRILSDTGWSGIKNLDFATCKTATTLFIYGVATIDEGASSTYHVLQLYSDGSSADVSAQYIFTSTAGGSFVDNVFTADDDPGGYDDYQVTISAIKQGSAPLTKQVTVHNTTPVVQISIEIVGPGMVDVGTSTSYQVIASYSNGTTQNLTNEYQLSSTKGFFSGSVLNIPAGNQPGNATIYASKGGVPLLSKPIVVNKLISGVLVVDLYRNPALNAIGFIENSEVVHHHVAAYTGNNIIPVSSAPPDALVLASDYFAGPATNWRFEFNIEKLMIDYPLTQKFVFNIKGRSTVAARLDGSYNVKTNDAVMRMVDFDGTLMPSVTGGSNHVPVTNFSANITAGANGSYDENDLRNIIKFTYDVPTDTTTFVINSDPIEVSDFDFMAIRYHWGNGDGQDLDILVGFENNGMPSVDGKYVGFGGEVTVPSVIASKENAFLWWALDNQGTEGYEGVLIGIKKFIQDNPSSPNIVEIALYAAWFDQPMSGNFSVELVTYKGGTMLLDGNNFVNEGGVQVSSNIINTQTLIRKTIQSPAAYFKVGVLRYNKITQTATIQIN